MSGVSVQRRLRDRFIFNYSEFVMGLGFSQVIPCSKDVFIYLFIVDLFYSGADSTLVPPHPVLGLPHPVSLRFLK